MATRQKSSLVIAAPFLVVLGSMFDSNHTASNATPFASCEEPLTFLEIRNEAEGRENDPGVD